MGSPYHVLFLGEESEKRIMPLLDVNVQEPGARQGAAAGAAHVPVQRVVVVLIVVQRTEDSAAARDVTGKLRHAGDTSRRGPEIIDFVRHACRNNCSGAVVCIQCTNENVFMKDVNVLLANWLICP